MAGPVTPAPAPQRLAVDSTGTCIQPSTREEHARRRGARAPRTRPRRSGAGSAKRRTRPAAATRSVTISTGASGSAYV